MICYDEYGYPCDVCGDLSEDLKTRWPEDLQICEDCLEDRYRYMSACACIVDTKTEHFIISQGETWCFECAMESIARGHF